MAQARCPFRPRSESKHLLDSIEEQHSPERRLALDDVLSGLLADGLIDETQSSQVRFSLRDSDGVDTAHPLVTLAEQQLEGPNGAGDILDAERLTRWLADRTGLPYVRIDPLKFNVAEATSVIKHAYATRFNILPIAVAGGRVTVATAEPYVREWEHELGAILKVKFDRVFANPQTLTRYISEFYALTRNLDGAVLKRTGVPTDTIGNLEQLVELEKIGEPDANDQHVVRIVDWLLQYAFDQRASDIHLEPRRDQSKVRFRIDGVLHLVNEMPTPVLTAVVSRLKSLGRLDVIERRRPQDGRVKTKSPNGREVELRLSTMPTAFGEKLVMRIFDPDVLVKSLTDLGFSGSDRTRWEQMVEQPHGMVIVTGPTGSGKTTTLYSTLKRIAKPEFNVCTIEDPIELVDPQLNQMHVQHNIGLDFATGVRTLLRQDPDIIMIGEIRDRETAETAVQAALTGHMVLTTLHTNDAPSSITRLLELGIAPYLIKSSLLGIAAQRLVRTLCEKCKQPSTISVDEWKSLVAPLRARRPVSVQEAVGCDECRHTGYKGRIGIYEMLRMSNAIRAEISPGIDNAKLRKLAVKDGMRPLRVSGAKKVQQGLTTAAEVISVVQDYPLEQ